MKLAIRHINKVRGRNGAHYYYCRKTGVRLPDPADAIAFAAAVQAARALPAPRAERPTPARRSFEAVVRGYKSSERHTRLAVSTRKEYDRHLANVWDALHDVDVTTVKTTHVVSLLSKFADAPTLQDAIRRTLSVVFNYARDVEELIESNPAERAGTKTRRNRRGSDAQGDREDKSQKPLEEQEIAAVRAANPVGTRRRAVFKALLGQPPRTAPFSTIARRIGAGYGPGRP